MRGKPAYVVGRLEMPGITPAHAGKTFLRNLKQAIRQDHPRACGENAETEAGYSAMIGSPPRMRGKQRNSAKSCR